MANLQEKIFDNTEEDSVRKGCEDKQITESVDGGGIIIPDPEKIPPWMHGVYLILLSVILIGMATASIVNLSRENPPAKEVWISLLSSTLAFIIPSPIQLKRNA